MDIYPVFSALFLAVSYIDRGSTCIAYEYPRFFYCQWRLLGICCGYAPLEPGANAVCLDFLGLVGRPENLETLL